MSGESCCDPTGASIDATHDGAAFQKYCVSTDDGGAPLTDNQLKTVYGPLFTQAVWNGLGLVSLVGETAPDSKLVVMPIMGGKGTKLDQLCYPQQTTPPVLLELQGLDSVLVDGSYS